MRAAMMGFDSLFNAFLRPQSIRRIEDGRKVNRDTARHLIGLSEETLRDMGYTGRAG